MENLNISNHTLIDSLYRKHSKKILNYIALRVNDRTMVENLAQDVWFKALTCGKPINEETALPFIYKIAANQVRDYLRSLYVRQGHADLSDVENKTTDTTPETDFYVRQIMELEQSRVECLPPQRRIIYMRSRFEDMEVSDISMELNLSTRTVENHLRLGRRDVREYLRAVG